MLLLKLCNTLSCTFNVPKYAVNVENIKNELTKTITTYSGEEVTHCFFTEDSAYLYVPRNYGIEKFKIDQVDLTFPFKQWSDVSFKTPATYREGQLEAIEKVTKDFQSGILGGLLNAPTGSGKCFLGTSIGQRLNTTVLVLVHKTDLLDNWLKLYDEEQVLYFPGISVGKVIGKTIDYKDKHIVFATFQSIYAKLDTLPQDFFESFGLVIVDEAHHVAAPTFFKILSRIKAKYRLGLSATFRRKDNLDFLFKFLIGKQLHKLTQTRVIGNYHVKNTSFAPKYSLFDLFPRSMYLKTMINDKNRNRLILSEILKAVEAGRHILVLTERRKHCTDLVAECNRLHVEAVPYFGSISNAEKKRAREVKVVIGTYQMVSEGTDIPSLDTLFLVSPKADLEQSVGRIQRPYDKKPVLVVYFLDNNMSAIKTWEQAQRNLNSLGFINGDQPFI